MQKLWPSDRNCLEPVPRQKKWQICAAAERRVAGARSGAGISIGRAENGLDFESGSDGRCRGRENRKIPAAADSDSKTQKKKTRDLDSYEKPDRIKKDAHDDQQL